MDISNLLDKSGNACPEDPKHYYQSTEPADICVIKTDIDIVSAVFIISRAYTLVIWLRDYDAGTVLLLSIAQNPGVSVSIQHYTSHKNNCPQNEVALSYL